MYLKSLYLPTITFLESKGRAYMKCQQTTYYLHEQISI